ncbi:VOC family protein [Bacillus sp. APMAM]|nr:VOC family protein [Bacillus sp. APMAM]RTZ57620.1 VOC family protein [Bacillus sp. SAJ1]
MRFHHFAIEVKDLETSVAFYKELFGLQEEQQIVIGEEKNVFLVSDHFRLELTSGGGQSVDLHQAVHICFEVNSIKEVIYRFNKHGIAALEGPIKLENDWQTVFFEGPNHEVIEFLQVNGERV